MPHYDAGHTFAALDDIHTGLRNLHLHTTKKRNQPSEDPLAQYRHYVFIPRWNPRSGNHPQVTGEVQVQWGLSNNTPTGAYPRVFIQGPASILPEASSLIWRAIQWAESRQRRHSGQDAWRPLLQGQPRGSTDRQPQSGPPPRGPHRHQDAHLQQGEAEGEARTRGNKRRRAW